jgi:hypothetical protein
MPTRFANLKKEKRKGGHLPFLFFLLVAFIIILYTFDSMLIWLVLTPMAGFVLKFIFSREAVSGNRLIRYRWFRYTDRNSKHKDKEFGNLNIYDLKNLNIKKNKR